MPPAQLAQRVQPALKATWEIRAPQGQRDRRALQAQLDLLAQPEQQELEAPLDLADHKELKVCKDQAAPQAQLVQRELEDHQAPPDQADHKELKASKDLADLLAQQELEAPLDQADHKELKASKDLADQQDQ